MSELSKSPSDLEAAVFTHLSSCLAELQSLPKDEDFRYFAQFQEFRKMTKMLRQSALGLIARTMDTGEAKELSLDDVVAAATERLSAVNVALERRSPMYVNTGTRLQLRFREPCNNAKSLFPLLRPKWRKIAAAASCPILCEEMFPREEFDREIRGKFEWSASIKPTWKPAEDIQLINTVDQLHSLAARLSRSEEVGVFVLSQTQHSYLGFTRALALCTREEECVIDAVALRSHISELATLFSSQDIIKVMHNSTLWTQNLLQDFGLVTRNCFDLTVAAAALNLPSASLAFMLKSYCGQNVDPTLNTGDWSSESLSESQLSSLKSCIASTLRLYDLLREELALKVGPEAVKMVNLSSSEICCRQPKSTIESIQSIDKGSLRDFLTWRMNLARMLDESEEEICPYLYIQQWVSHPPTSPQEIPPLNPYVQASAQYLVSIANRKQTQTVHKHGNDIYEKLGWKITSSASPELLPKTALDTSTFTDQYLGSILGLETSASEVKHGLTVLIHMKTLGHLPYISINKSSNSLEPADQETAGKRIPESIEEIYELSNANRKRAKKNKAATESVADTQSILKSEELPELFAQLGWGSLTESRRGKSL